jgi:two-component system, cell cycle sensor histidine kinase and response regulator CckA
VLIDPSQIEQVVLNLVVNARHAMPQGGQLVIEVANAGVDENYVAAHPGVSAGAYVRLSVSDTGVGMDAATCGRIFEPFFTTKEQGRGTGLGLSTVWGTVTQSRGHIWVQSELGRGTTFHLYLPRVDHAVDEVPAQSTSASIAGGNETILLVEDEEQVRALMRGILSGHGYDVVEAANGGEALLVCEQHRGQLDLLLSDIVMPRMNGRDLAARLGPMRPDMKVLLVSGYDEVSVAQQGALDPSIPFLPKPITPDVLLRKVREVLDSNLVRAKV